VPAASATVEVDAIAVPGSLARPFGASAWAVRVEGGRIASVTESRRDGPRLRVLVPLLANAHDHGRGLGTVAQGVRDAPLDAWIGDLIATTKPGSQRDLVTVGLTRMLASGVGAVVVCVNPTTDDRDAEVRVAVDAARSTGMRAAIAYPLSDVSRGTYREGRDRDPVRRDAAERALDDVGRLAEEVGDDGIDVIYHPVGPQWASEDLLVAVAERSAADGRLVHMHLLETATQRVWADATYPNGIVTALDEIGLLTARAWFAHGVHLTATELGLLRERGCGLAINASSNLRLSSGIPPIADAAGLPGAGIGLDGMGLDDDLDMWSELRLVRGLWQGQGQEAIPADDVLALATAGAGRAVGAAAPPPVAIGGSADFVVLDLTAWEHLATTPQWTVEEIALATAGAAVVAEVWCRGGQLIGGRKEDR
jgi:cytosine/adenosine deaminase-related metal-dependent hydrolase